MKDYEKSKEFLQKKFDEFLDIPACRDYLDLIARDMQKTFQSHLKMHKNLKQSFRELAYGEMEVYEEESSAKNSTFRFDLRQRLSGHWILEDIEPALPPEITQQELISNALVLTLAKFPINPDSIETVDGYFDTSGGKRRYHVQFTRYELDYIMGAIRVGLEAQESEVEAEEPESETQTEESNVLRLPVTDRKNEFKRRCDQENYDKMIACMMGSDEIKEAMFNYFFNFIQPLEGIELL